MGFWKSKEKGIPSIKPEEDPSRHLASDPHSELFEDFCRRLEKRSDRTAVLDLGTAQERKIQHFADRHIKVYAEDVIGEMIAGLSKTAGEATSEDETSRSPLDLSRFEDASFDGALCWTVFNHCDGELASRLGKELQRILKPSALVLALFLPARIRSFHGGQAFEVSDDEKVKISQGERRGLGIFLFENRQIHLLLDGFQFLRFTTLKDGSRIVYGIKVED